MGNSQAALTYTGIVATCPVYCVVILGVKAVTLVLPYEYYFSLDNICYWSYQSFMRIYFESHAGLKLTFHGDKPKEENCIYMSNHQSNMDWFIPVLLGSDIGTAGRIRYILKDTLRLLPFYGWYFEQHGCVYITKGAGFGHQRLIDSLHWFKNQPNIPFWMVLYPEGTRYDPDHDTHKERKAELCAAHGLNTQDLSLVAFPRKKAFTTCVSELRERCDAIYDVTVMYNVGGSLRKRPHCCSMETLMGGGYNEIHVHLKRHEIAQMPTETSELDQWLVNSYVQKNKMMEEFYQGGELPGEVWYNKPTYTVMKCAIFWNLLLGVALSTKFTRKVYLGSILVGGIGASALSAVIMKHNRKPQPQ